MTRPALLAAQPVRHARILGVGGVRGENVVVNDDIAGPINSSDEWIRQRTGIVSRRRAGEETTVVDLAEGAANAALEAAGITGAEVDAVIVGTVTWFEQTPSLAAVLADRIGATPAAAYDISAACAGYAYGIAQADALVRAGTARNVLVVGVEKMSDFIDPTDRSISFLLGDGAGAAVVGPSDAPGIGRTVWGSDGSAAKVIGQTHSWLDYRNAEPGADVEWPTLRQEGPSVYKWAVFQMTPVAKQAIEAAGLTPEDIDVFLPHQANMRIIDHMVKYLGLREDVVIARDIAETGNTSAASIPLATERLLREGQAKSGDIALQIGFGAGLAYAAQVVVLP
ncbi:beta-ketoacyl-ACP synthase III [Georgenia yuyongxinii]|uniref:Beta-ketoacyl-[acyl-carrier-protein] synthase III n=1 Tax=Georgenia yuyongxinii TaxID=2589797 RepID=A0A552WX39_9MICO|nr:beta-ketoacyl-ACP synthase III [Georgenia yuyongxinii]TRW46873.1 ketoacyl-ACP synthase III [Georgenia yuyongxinii]